MVSVATALPLSELGHCTGRFYLDDRRPLIAMRCYFDGSYGDDDSKNSWVTLAGFMANDGFWGTFQLEWEQMLRDRDPIAPYIHMNEINGGLRYKRGPFTEANGWTEGKLSRLVFDALCLFQRLDVGQAYKGFFCSLNKTSHDGLIASGKTLCPAPSICTTACLSTAFEWYSTAHPNRLEKTYIFFDQNEPFMHEFRQKWLKKNAPKRKISTEPFWGLIGNIQPLDMRDNPALQAADMLAWARSRSLSQATRNWRYLAEVMWKIVPQSGVILDRDELEKSATIKP